MGSVPGRTEIQLRFHRLHDVAKKKINKIKPHSLQKSTQEQKYNKEARKYIQRFKKLQMFWAKQSQAPLLPEFFEAFIC